MDKYSIAVESELFKEILVGNAEYVIQLNDYKSNQFKVGNIIKLVDKSEGSEIDAKIENFFYFKNFKDLFSMINKEKFGYGKTANIDIIEDNYVKNFTDEKIEKYGIVAIKFIREK